MSRPGGWPQGAVDGLRHYMSQREGTLPVLFDLIYILLFRSILTQHLSRSRPVRLQPSTLRLLLDVASFAD